ncbi:hypothetical protein CAPTEDRAFT_205419 [Capitella teleta]|uniref:Phytanoyl-CoA hydroxylase-interacting protein-like C-terminal domain-containing protein n=1 Tax=Capitella teleta TaxID=283909 RepID=R7V5Y5_CAPTE|nr:hypothetical protein CAPTEDRAFT_205419 [Capitella teleta]|eukprot:ELU13994.1 hypothetical protein CAPTEDRAFT_205419 [Capitella teleta]
MAKFHSVADLEFLYKKAVGYAAKQLSESQWNKNWQLVKYFYRDTSEERKLTVQRDQIMEMYVNDNNGDPRCPINGRLNGLHFATNINYGTGLPYEKTPYEKWRFIVPHAVMYRKCPNVYFSNFFCHWSGGPHHLSLVMTRSGSDADRFCLEHLPPVDMETNTFLRIQQQNDKTMTSIVNHGIWVEIFYTENVPIPPVDIKNPEWFLNDPENVNPQQGELQKPDDCRTCNVDR